MKTILKKMSWCSHCSMDCETDCDFSSGYVSCRECGKVLTQFDYNELSSFVKDSGKAGKGERLNFDILEKLLAEDGPGGRFNFDLLEKVLADNEASTKNIHNDYNGSENDETDVDEETDDDMDDADEPEDEDLGETIVKGSEDQLYNNEQEMCDYSYIDNNYYYEDDDDDDDY